MRPIDADVLKDDVPETPFDIIDEPRNCCSCSALDKEDVLALIDKQPTINAVLVKHGKWILKKELVPLPWDCDPLDWDNYDESTHSEWVEFYHCSNCDYKSGHFKGTNYCPNCGAKMDE